MLRNVQVFNATAILTKHCWGSLSWPIHHCRAAPCLNQCVVALYLVSVCYHAAEERYNENGAHTIFRNMSAKIEKRKNMQNSNTQFVYKLWTRTPNTSSRPNRLLFDDLHSRWSICSFSCSSKCTRNKECRPRMNHYQPHRHRDAVRSGGIEKL